MTDPAAATTSPDAPTVSWWEDFLEIFLVPGKVFSRRANASFWIPLLVFTVVGAALLISLGGPLRVAAEADLSRGLAANPDVTPEQAAAIVEGQLGFGVYLIIASLPVVTLLVGLSLWLLGKLFGATERLSQAMLIASFAAFPKLLGFIASGVQGLLLPPQALDSMTRVTLSPARFLDPDTASAGVIAIAVRFDLTILWATLLLAIGVKVIGKIPMGNAVGAAAAVWVVGTIPSLLGFLGGQ